MSLEVDFLPVAVANGSNVDSQAAFQGSGYQETGFSVGIAQPSQVNKILRQSSMVSAAVANFIANTLNSNVIDDGDLGNLITLLTEAIAAAASGAATRVVSVSFSATPVFDCSQGLIFEMVLTGNVTSSTITNIAPGQKITFILKQDATGGRTFTPPASIPSFATGPTGAGQIAVQSFIVDSGSSIYPLTPEAIQ